MILKLGLKEIKSNIVINILCLLQIIMIFITICAMTSSVISRFEKYVPFRSELNKKGVFFCVEQLYFGDQDVRYVTRNEEDIKERLNLVKVDSVTCIKDVWVLEDINVRAYSTDLINRYKPILENGVWLSEGNNFTDDMIAGVISDNYDNIEVGDVIEISEAFSEDKLKVYIVGKFNEKTSIIGFTAAANGKYSYENLYENYSCDDWQRPMLLINSDELEKKGSSFYTQVKNLMIINYSDDISNEEIESNFKNLTVGNFLPGYSTLDDMNKNSRKQILEEVIRLLPMVISIFVLTMLSILSVSAVNARSRIKTYAIYYICGMKWNHIVTIEVIKSSSIVVLAGIISIMICNYAKNKLLFGGLLIETGTIQLLCCLVIGILFVLLSAIFPKIITGKEKPVTVFHAN